MRSPLECGVRLDARLQDPLAITFHFQHAMLLLHEVDPPVLGAALVGVVGGERNERAHPVGPRPRRRDALLGGEFLDHGFGAPLGERDITFERPHGVGINGDILLFHPSSWSPPR